MKTADKDDVFVCLVLGTEPKKISSPDDCLDIDSVILRMAEKIKAAREKSDDDPCNTCPRECADCVEVGKVPLCEEKGEQ
jgi:hypothetical protein